MQHIFTFIKQSRSAFIRLIDSLSIDELNAVPEGFNNNIIWNFGHIVVSTQALCYVRTGIKADASFISYLQAYTKGSKPTYFVSQQEVDELKRLAVTSIEQIEKDYQSGVFTSVAPFATDTYKESITSFQDVITLTAGHDNLHYGYAIAQKRLISK